jgi:6-phosphogluconolactonase
MENIVISQNTEVKIFRKPEELFIDSAGYICASIRHYINKFNRSTLVLSGGHTPKRLYDEISNNYKELVDWSNVYFFWGDERCVPPDNIDSNYKTAKEHLLSKLPVPAANIFRIRGEDKPEKAAYDYEDIVKNYFDVNKVLSFDNLLLGVGEDGHTASLFPGTKVLNVYDKYASEVYSERLKSWRVTLTFPLINKSKNIFLIAAGNEKSGIIKKVFTDNNGKFPVQKIHPSDGKLTWFLDEEAAGDTFSVFKK